MHTVSFLFIFVLTVVTESIAHRSICWESQRGDKWYADCRHKGLINTRAPYFKMLSFINLADNEITTLEDNEFQASGQVYLEDIILRNNRLQHIERLAFDGLRLLRSLDLSYNRISVLPNELFLNNFNLLHLNLSFNELSRDMVLAASNLQVLDLAECQLHQFPLQCLNSAPNLRYVNLSLNRIENIHVQELFLNYLQDIQLQSNDFRCGHEELSALNWLHERNIRITSDCKHRNLAETEKLNISHRPVNIVEKMVEFTSAEEDEMRIEDEMRKIEIILLAVNIAISATVLLVLTCYILCFRSNSTKTGTSVLPDDEAPPPYITITR